MEKEKKARKKKATYTVIGSFIIESEDVKKYFGFNPTKPREIKLFSSTIFKDEIIERCGNFKIHLFHEQKYDTFA